MPDLADGEALAQELIYRRLETLALADDEVGEVEVGVVE